ncbi:hypothetical protein PITC_003630 [Penicillium italicum]|uniref:LysM domain-containing protein n=1 Tax=Penicillium italicum TaxID=40296 RepID=A0A0A2L216_PENIT|nr:hypothetical protein PITC_003630 [Penicillium italicum]
MHLTALLAVGAVPAMAAAITRRAVNCDFSTTADAGATCSSFASSWGLSVDNLQQLNPGITCPDLDTNKSYCVVGTGTDEPSSTISTNTTTTTTTTTSKTSTTTDSVPSNSPTMAGIASNCDRFHKVSSDEQCGTIAANYSISEAQFKSWNSQVDAGTFFASLSPYHSVTGQNLTFVDCTNLWLDYYVCVHVPGATTVPAPQPTAEPTGPTPQMPGIVSNCKIYHLINSSDSCYSINLAAKITLAQFRAGTPRLTRRAATFGWITMSVLVSKLVSNGNCI